jgi:hypothetical protein
MSRLSDLQILAPINQARQLSLARSGLLHGGYQLLFISILQGPRWLIVELRRPVASFEPERLIDIK